MLIAADGHITKRIDEPHVGNGQKFWIYPIPGFDVDTFPFVISSGWEMFKIINVKNGTMQVFIRTPCKYYTGQPGGFFLKEINGYSFHFAQEALDKEHGRWSKWYSM